MKTIEEVIEACGGLARGPNLPLKRKGGRTIRGCCIIEAESVRLGLRWTDNPSRVRMLDVRALNDGPWSAPSLLKKHMLRLHAAYVGSLDWPMVRQCQVMEAVAVLTVQRIIADLPGLPYPIREQLRTSCRSASTLDEARGAARHVAEHLTSDSMIPDRTAAFNAVDLTLTGIHKLVQERPSVASWNLSMATSMAASAAEYAAIDEPERQPQDDVLIRAVDLWIEAAS